jgi:hypothetical protein
MLSGTSWPASLNIRSNVFMKASDGLSALTDRVAQFITHGRSGRNVAAVSLAGVCCRGV